MILVTYIQELLIENDCVIVPGLGGFVCNYQSAQLVGSNNCTLFPPTKHIIFNTKLTHNDGLLASHISKQQSIGYEQAVAIIKNETDSLRASISANGYVIFEGLGKLLKTENQGLAFIQSEDFQCYPHSFGLNPIVYSKIQKKQETVSHIPISRGVHKRKTIPTLVKQSIILVPMFLLAALLPSMYLKNNYEATIIQLQKSAPVKTETANNTQNIKTASPKTVSITAHYFIIAGSFKNQEAALSLSKQLRNEGYKSQVIEKGDFFKVSVQSFQNLNDANSFLISLQDSDARFVDAWLMMN